MFDLTKMCGLTASLATAFIFIQLTCSVHIHPTIKDKWPEECEGSKYCTVPSINYPHKLIEDIVRRNDKLQELGYTVSFKDRDGNNSPQVCESIPNTDPVYEIKDDKGRMRYVVQTEMLRQIVRIDKCEKLGEVNQEMKLFDPDSNPDVTLHCKQKSIDFKFIVLSLDYKNIDYVDVRGGLPVCCSASIDY